MRTLVQARCPKQHLVARLDAREDGSLVVVLPRLAIRNIRDERPVYEIPKGAPFTKVLPGDAVGLPLAGCACGLTFAVHEATLQTLANEARRNGRARAVVYTIHPNPYPPERVSR